MFYKFILYIAGVQVCIMNDKNHVKDRIKKVLSEHPEGLTILDIAKLVGVHRHTVTKYVYHLIGSGEIYQREVGTARLCYLKERLVERVKEKEILDKIKKRLERE